MYALEKYYSEMQIEPHTEYFNTYEEAEVAKEKFYSRKGYHYAEIIRRS